MHAPPDQHTNRRQFGPPLLAILAILAMLASAALAVTMLFPHHWNGIGKLGQSALLFPLHLLLLAALAACLAWVSARRGLRPASIAAAVAATTAVLLALLPAVALWRTAGALQVPLSLADYLANARHLSVGPAQPQRTIRFATANDGAPLLLDVWSTGRSNTGPLRPALLMVHGGGWRAGNRSLFPRWNAWFNQQGYEVFDVEYRMPASGGWHDELADVEAALSWIARHAADYHLSPAHISVMGDSAGAHLAMLAAYRDRPGQPRVRALVNFYGPSDLTRLYQDTPSPAYVRPLLERFLDGAPAQYPDRYARYSPLSHVGPQSPPTISFLGDSDRLVPRAQADLLDQALRQAQVPHETWILPWTDHAFDANWGGFATQIARARLQRFMQRYAALN